MTTPNLTMRAAAIDRFGGADLILLRELPVPDVGTEEVLIRVEAAGVGSWDAVERQGGYEEVFGMPSTFPYILGWDGAGTVAAVGSSVSRFAQGERVYAASMPVPRGGFYAEYAVAHQDHVAPIPAGLAIEQAAAMPWDALTAASGLDALELEPGAAVMILGASGGIGHMAVQMAKRRGIKVLAVASGADGLELVSRLGADTAVDGHKEEISAVARQFATRRLHALVLAGGPAADRALTAITDGGRVAVPNGVEPEPRLSTGVRLLHYDGVRDPDATLRLNRLIESGPFEVHIQATFPLQRVADAHRLLDSHYVGKIALQIAAPPDVLQ